MENYFKNVHYDLMELFEMLIPDGTDQECSDGVRSFHIKNENGKITVTSRLKEKEYDDSEIKKQVKKFKDIIDELNDDLFIDIVEKAKCAIDIKRFDELLELDSYNFKTATEVKCLMDYFMKLIKNAVDEEWNRLVELKNRINN